MNFDAIASYEKTSFIVAVYYYTLPGQCTGKAKIKLHYRLIYKTDAGLI